MKTLGTLLIAIGILALAYQEFSYTKTDQIVKIGSLELNADTKETIPIPPIISFIALFTGCSILVLGLSRSK